MKHSLTRLPALFLLAVIAFAGMATPAKAFTPPCEWYECPGAAPSAWAAYGTAVAAALTTLELQMKNMMYQIKDAVVRLANQRTNNLQETSTARSGLVDTVNTARFSSATASARIANASSFIPSRIACGVESQSDTMFARTVAYRAATGAGERKNSAVFSNGPSTPGEKGQLAYLSKRYDNRMTRYCNAGAMDVSCTPTHGADRDLKPYDSIFKFGKFDTTKDYEAAVDVVTNLMGNVVADGVKGASLDRQEGRTLNVVRMSEQAKLNLSASVLMSMVERRKDDGSGTSQAAVQSANSFAEDASRMLWLAENGSGQNDESNMDGLAALIGASNRQLYDFRMLLEQLAMIRATSLAMETKENGARNNTLSLPISAK